MGRPAVPRLTLATVAPAVAALLALGGCGDERPPMPTACVESARLYDEALGAAPGRVLVAERFLISTCVSRATSEGDLQNLGVLLTATAERLGVRARDGRDVRAATQLGFLAGAVERGATRTDGIQAELARRVGRAAVKLDGAGTRLQEALVRGAEAGRTRG